MDAVRLDGTVRTNLDIIEVIKEIKNIKSLDFISWLEHKKEIDFTYEGYLGLVKCSVVKEGDFYSGDLKYSDKYYKIDSRLAMNFFSRILAFIEENKNN